MLRKWQIDCVTKALNTYNSQKHFLCLATPGAGKTIMAASLAKRLLQEARVDFIICFAPTSEVVASLNTTFSRVLNESFDGRIGARGGAYTYQSMRTLGDKFWQLFDRYQIMVIFDEIHHCSGGEGFDGNSWGREITRRVQEKAVYTLALSGTPWRSDNNPIVLTNYSDTTGKVECDYTYGLSSAVRDKICRIPNIVVIDNESIQLQTENEIEEFEGFDDLLMHSNARYEDLLFSQSVLRYCLKTACNSLDNFQASNPKAAGLIVASSVSHAMLITEMLRDDFQKSVVIVTYRQKNPNKLINSFRSGSQDWIVSVGMISEGTDIPRLQVCCHLSRIKTELHFRQVLGRVLRTTEDKTHQTGLLITLAEPNLISYATRITENIPFSLVSRKVIDDGENSEYTSNIEMNNPSERFLKKGEINSSSHCFVKENEIILNKSHPANFPYMTLECLGKFRQRLVDSIDLY